MNLEDQQLVAAAFDGALDEAGFRQLQERLREEPALLAHYREQALLHHALCEEFEGRRMIGDPLPPVAGRRWRGIALLGAALLLLWFAGWGWQRVFPPAPRVAAADCDFSADAIARVEGRPVEAEQRLAIGARLTVERGWVRLKLAKNGLALVEAPASVVLEADRLLRVGSGRVRVRCPDGGDFTVATPRLTAVGRDAEFGVLCRADPVDEVHGIRGRIEVSAAAGGGAVIGGGEAVALDPAGGLERIPARGEDFEALTTGPRVLLEERFDGGPPLAGRRPPVGDSTWRLEKGDPQLTGTHLEGEGFEAYFSLPPDGLSPSRPVLLATLKTESSGNFHSDGWAGMSLYQDGYEICFFGDSYGPEVSWSLDVKRSLYPLMPERPVTGARTMTLRYDRRDGAVELHEGAEPGAEPLVRSKILPGLSFDQVRIGASPEASLAISELSVRAVGEMPPP